MEIIKKTIMASTLLIILTACISTLPEDRLSSANTALLVIDVQNAYLPVYNYKNFLNNIQILITQAREADIPVIYIRNLDGKNQPGSYGWEFHKQIMPEENDFVIEKERPSSFYQTTLKDLLKKLKTEHLVLTGLASSGCYGATVSDAILNNYNTHIVTDAHSDKGKAAVDALNNGFADYNYVIMTETENVVFVSTP